MADVDFTYALQSRVFEYNPFRVLRHTAVVPFNDMIFAPGLRSSREARVSIN